MVIDPVLSRNVLEKGKDLVCATSTMPSTLKKHAVSRRTVKEEANLMEYVRSTTGQRRLAVLGMDVHPKLSTVLIHHTAESTTEPAYVD